MNLVDEFYGNIGTSEKHNANGDVVDSENKPIDIPAPIKLEWTTPPDTKSAVREACTEIDGYMKINNYGRSSKI